METLSGFASVGWLALLPATTPLWLEKIWRQTASAVKPYFR
jgi:hypothetical protein